MRTLALTVALFFSTLVHAQRLLKGVVADSATKEPLPFATVQPAGKNTAVIAAIGGRFSINIEAESRLQFSYSGHRAKTVSSSSLKEGDTVFLATLTASMEEVLVRSQSDEIRRIINAAIRAKPVNNPDRYPNYQCRIYYKMTVDITAYDEQKSDSVKKRRDSLQAAKNKARKQKNTTSVDTSDTIPFVTPSHLYLTETYSRKLYKHPGQTQEIVLASKFAGLHKTYVANMVTDVLPFHVYGDYIPLNGTDFINPVAKGWQGRYRFVLEDEIAAGDDTVFLLRYAPKKGATFHSLKGLVYISSRGYAVTHFTGTNATNDSVAKRFVKFEHIYRLVNGRWFPQELNYDFGIRNFPEPHAQLRWNGRSVIDSVSFAPLPSNVLDKAHPVKFSDSVDLRNEKDWNRYRADTLTAAEENTYKNMDTLMKRTPMEGFITLSARLATGRFPIGKLDVDVQRLFASNGYEGTRLGMGLYTNNTVSKYISVGGWWGYGFKDKAAKGGGSVTLYPKGDKETLLHFSYQKNLRLTGEVTVHPDLSAPVLRNWLLQQVDEFKEYAVAANVRPGYWEIRPSLSWQEVGPLHYSFQSNGKAVTSFTTKEATVGLRYAYGEKRVPFFEYYLPAGTKYPVVYASLSRGAVSAAGYKADYWRALATITFVRHINRWGADRYQLEGGWLRSFGDEPLPRSLLMAGNGYRRDGLNFYAYGGFLTLRPFAVYNDRYVSLLYRHELDKSFWNTEWSKPSLSLSHNLMYGGLRNANVVANGGLQPYGNGYHESGVLLNRLLKCNLGFADAGLNVGAFYHWQKKGDWKKNSVWVMGLSIEF